MSRSGLGTLEHLVLLGILRLGDEAYGVPILEEITARTSRRVSRATVYVALSRLERKGLVRSRMTEPTGARGGRAKKVYALTEHGLARLRAARLDLHRMWEGVEEALNP